MQFIFNRQQQQQQQVILNTQVGRLKHMRVMPGGALETENTAETLFCGRKLEEHRGAFILEQPMENGIVHGWDAMEVLWEVRGLCLCVFVLGFEL